MSEGFFPSRSNKSPKIYGYTELSEEYNGLIKVGYTERTVSQRMMEHYPTSGPKDIKRYEVLVEESSMRNDGTFFKDYLIHKILEKNGYERVGSEWFRCSVDQLKAAIIAAKNRDSMEPDRVYDFSMRPEQQEAVNRTKAYFKSYKAEENKTPHFLWNCKMRFGKTFSAYKLSEAMNWKKVLVLTFKPAVEDSWKDDLLSHKDFQNWQFIQGKTETNLDIKGNHPYVCFASFQDFLGKSKSGGIKVKNQWAHKIDWDCIILDEYHYGAWRDNAKGMLSSEDEYISKENLEISREHGFKDLQKDWDENISPLKTKHYLYLSGTPFRAIESGEFIEEQIYNWTYTDEQDAKENWVGEDSPYESLPRMVMMTYKMPDAISQITDTGEFDEFNLNEFFKATGDGEKAKFKYENHVQQWLDLIRGSGIKNVYTSLKVGSESQYFPFQHASVKNLLTHTFWFLPSVASCYAMRNLMMQRANTFYHDYEVIVCAGAKVGIGVKSLIPVREKMSDNPLKTKTITLSCGKLTTGVTVKPWTGVFMLRNTSSPETYFQTAFRVQSPWTIGIENSPNKQEILKKECYIFDFAPNRALRLITEYSCKLSLEDADPEVKVREFVKFLPVLCFDGSSMGQIDARAVLDIGTVGTSGSQLAVKFKSAKLVHVDNETLARLMKNPQAIEKLMKIEGFRNINSDIETIINKSKKINDLKKDPNENLPPKKKKEISDAEREQKSLRKKIQEKLQQFATRIPVFMYLTDHREISLKDLIQKVEPDLFRKVTSLSIEDFDLLISLGLFNSTEMNSAVGSFKRYEDASLHYEGLTKHDPKKLGIGLWDTVLQPEEFYIDS